MRYVMQENTRQKAGAELLINMNHDLNTFEIKRLDEFERAKKLDDRCNVDDLADFEVGILMASIALLTLLVRILEYVR
jgi:hypothetical protein